MLRIHGTAVGLVRDCVGVAREIERHDPDLARQLRRAIVRVPLNVAEEARSAIIVAEAAGYIGPVAEAIRSGFRAVIGTLDRCVAPAR